MARGPDMTAKKKRVIASYSEKGGVGKSALAAGLAAVARRHKKVRRVLAGDLDPRGTFTAEVGITEPAFTMNDLLFNDTRNPVSPRGLAAEALIAAPEAWSGLYMIPADRSLAHRETDATTGLEMRLRLSFEGVIEEDDLGVLDLPPRAGGKLVSAGLVAATDVVIPATLDEDGRIGTDEAMATIKLVQDTFNPGLRVVAIVPSIVPPSKYPRRLAAEIAKYLADTYPDYYREDLTIPEYQERREARFACLPITSSTSDHGLAVVAAYDRILTASLNS
ncbi:ParA family protein [Kitasatospora aureofaciens]|uniref:ParA family protein n=1 Tax=Kitasatospora aureofaciens TaxID=1894 RepID=UPI001C4549A2|nr:ParA family protein [Kitasatospora aureofaciens]MBV6700248.1 ParA family protein [Kitasatospora aureofaciens]